MSGKITVVISQAQGKHPVKRGMEESLAAALLMEPGIDLSIVPHLVDLQPGHTGRLYLEGITGDVVVLAWLFPRAAFWLLDRIGVKGVEGTSPTHPKPAEDEELTDEEKAELAERPPPIGATGAIPDRVVTCLDMRAKDKYEVFVEEVRRLGRESAARRQAKQAERAVVTAAKPPVLMELGMPTARLAEYKPEQLLEAPAMRRWYPVIDYSRCTNCLECLDFCLFGVYGADEQGRITVENQDNCKKGCPACSRVCPAQAIMFPEYKTAAIAGAPVGAISGLKIDLSKLFGGGLGGGGDAISLAAQERDRELVKDGRDAVGLAVGIPKRQTGKSAEPRDSLDDLVDALDSLDI